MRGLHLIADLQCCSAEAMPLRSGGAALPLVRALCEHASLTVVGEAVHDFPGGGYTLALLLAESHVTVHTWPELESATLDVYVCNFTKDNTQAARAVVQGVIALFGARAPSIREIERGELTTSAACAA